MKFSGRVNSNFIVKKDTDSFWKVRIAIQITDNTNPDRKCDLYISRFYSAWEKNSCDF